MGENIVAERNPQVCIMITAMFLATSFASAQTGMRIKVVSHTTGFPRPLDTFDQTTTAYAQGAFRRIELPPRDPHDGASARMILIQRCAQHVAYVLNLDEREYTESLLPSPEESAKRMEEVQKQWTAGPPNLIIETTVRDTGETKLAFGHTAHHYIKTTKETPSPELGMEPSEIIEDAWYLDVPDPRSCETASGRPHGMGGGIGIGSGSGRAFEKIHPEFKYSGPEPQGLVLASKRTTRTVHHLQTGERQDNQLTTSTEIVELSDERIDPALFQIPSGFKKVSQMSH